MKMSAGVTAFSSGKMSKLLRLMLCCWGFAWLTGIPAAAQTVGDIVPPWTPGTLDIHQINTGKGNAAFFILPDGTTMLVDAGSSEMDEPYVTPPRPDGSRTPGDWIVRYVTRMLSHVSSPVIDYAILTHFHGDHLGTVTPGSRLSDSGAYKLTGITEVGDRIPIRTMLDRGWPDYRYPEPLTGETIDNYRSFLNWQKEYNGMTIERFQPGRNDQIVLVHDPDSYPGFRIQNIAANGEIWTGVGTATRHHFPEPDVTPLEDRPDENMCSCALRLSYGQFDYFTGGDMPGLPDAGAPSWHDVETPVAKAVGPVEVNVANHHGIGNTQNAFFLSILRPRVHIIPVWAADQPGLWTYFRLTSRRLYPGPRDIFALNLMDINRLYSSGRIHLTSEQGHILVRVAPGGASYKVIILDDSAETYRITAVHGPYRSR